MKRLLCAVNIFSMFNRDDQNRNNAILNVCQKAIFSNAIAPVLFQRTGQHLSLNPWVGRLFEGRLNKFLDTFLGYCAEFSKLLFCCAINPNDPFSQDRYPYRGHQRGRVRVLRPCFAFAHSMPGYSLSYHEHNIQGHDECIALGLNSFQRKLSRAHFSNGDRYGCEAWGLSLLFRYCIIIFCIHVVFLPNEGLCEIPLEASAKGLEAAENFLEGMKKIEAPVSLDTFLASIEKQPSKATMKAVTAVLEKGQDCGSCGGNAPENVEKLPHSDIVPDAEIIVFVTLSLGKETLQRLSRDLEKVGGRMVVRGLTGNSFPQMQKAIQALEINVDIDPPLFEEFKVEIAPTFIVRPRVKNGEAATEGKSAAYTDRLSGNLKLETVLEIIADEGETDVMPLLKILRGER